MVQTRLCQTLAREPSPAKNPVGWYPVKEGANLPSSVTEDILGFSISREYSPKQLRRINRRNSLHGNLKVRSVNATRESVGSQIPNRWRRHNKTRKMLLDIERAGLEQ